MIHLFKISFFLSFILLLSNCSPKKTAAEAKYDSLTKDFGDKKFGDTVNIIFSVKNVGNSDLSILKVESGCECTVVNYSKKPLKPNETGKIEIRYIPNDHELGKMYKEIIVKSNAIKQIQLLSITGKIKV